MPESFLQDLVVVEMGDRLAVGACGALLAQLGATVILVEESGRKPSPETKWKIRPVVAAGKKSFEFNAARDGDAALLKQLVARADVLLVSDDMQPSWVRDATPAPDAGEAIVCNISAFGCSGPLRNRPYSDVLVQAMAGIMDTTGAPDGAPIPAKFPIMEFTTAMYATAGILAALRARDQQGISQTVEVALYDDGMSMLSSFLASYFVGGEPCRIGNHHPSMSPWNLYQTSDGWALICAGSDEQWRRMCQMFDRPEFSTDPRFVSPTMRVQNHVQVDEIVERWTRQLTTVDCIGQVSALGIACGPVISVAELFDDANLSQHGMFCELRDPATGKTIRVPGFLFNGSVCKGRAPSSIPPIDHDRASVRSLIGAGRKSRRKDGGEAPRPPLSGLRVVEIGNYTTAPFVGRQLGALGAYVVKVEAPGGDLGRSLPPVRDGQGYFFTLGNSDKRSLMIDLRSEIGKRTFRDLLSKADVLVQNLKAGSLGRLGFTEDEIARINPRLVYCATSGFGANSPYADRAAMDTTIQGVSGVMDLTRAANGVPHKTGVSIADLAGGLFGLVAALAGLAYRERTGRGQFIDLSMHTASAWLTQTAWNAALPHEEDICLVGCEDGYVVAEADADAVGAGNRRLRRERCQSGGRKGPG